MFHIFALSLLVYGIYVCLKTTKSLQMLQQNRYNRGNKYMKWLKCNLKRNYVTVEMLILCIPFFLLCQEYVAILLFNVLYFIIAMTTAKQYRKEQKKIPLHFTARILRLCVTVGILYSIPLILCYFTFKEEYIVYYYILLSVASYFNNLLVVLANFSNVPVENFVSWSFKNKASKKLKSLPNMDVIGVTGSYGKTSSKQILCAILNSKFTAVASPKNFNTHYGLIISINEYLDKFTDYFIAEMGACKKGEIKELCDLVKPKYAILTKIGVAHLETFKTEDAIQRTKFELVESLPSDGIAVLNADDLKQVSYTVKNDCKVLWIGIENDKKADVVAKKIQLNKEGTTFECHFKKKKKKYVLQTKLLGKLNVYNILAAVALADALGISEEEITLGVSKIKPVEHRLELKPYYSMHLIDDAYNANPEGTKMSLDVLASMDGKKIVISSGMIELGIHSYELNKELGNYMAKKTDIVILIGKEQTKAILEGLKEKKFKEENIFVFNNIQDAFTLIKQIGTKDTYVLLQSDLPDIFNEK